MDVSKLMFRDGLMAGERILVTGGGTGLGREMAEAFLKLGATVYICGRRQNKLDETAAELTAAHGGKIVGMACDIRDADAIHAMVDAIWADGGALTGVVNNAAGNFISRTEDLSVNGFNAIADIVMRGTFYVTLDIGKRLIAEKKRASFPLDPHHLGVVGQRLRGAVCHEQDRDQCHDPESGDRMGPLWPALQCHPRRASFRPRG